MANIKVVNVGNGFYKTELTSEQDGTESISFPHVRFVFKRGDWWIDAPNIQFTKYLLQRIAEDPHDLDRYIQFLDGDFSP